MHSSEKNKKSAFTPHVAGSIKKTDSEKKKVFNILEVFSFPVPEKLKK